MNAYDKGLKDAIEKLNYKNIYKSRKARKDYDLGWSRGNNNFE